LATGDAAMVLVDAQLRVVHANTVANTLLAAGDLIKTESGRLTVCAPGADQALAVAVAQASDIENGTSRQGFNVPICGHEGHRHVLHVLPVRAGTLRSVVMPGIAAAVFVAPTQTPRPTSIQAVAASFGLGAMETRVLERITRGEPDKLIAKALGIGAATVRTHMLRIFNKTGIHQRAGLMALVASFDLPLAA
jgi:DNA-binding CsgD family transcriptional regulator